MNEIFNYLINLVIKEKCSDFHLDLKDKLYMYFRKNGLIINFHQLDYQIGKQLLNYILYISNIDIIDCLTPVTSSYEYTYLNKRYYLRISKINTNDSLSLVIRILNNHDTLSINDLTSINIQRNFIKNVTQLKSGLVLFCGKTGSGKTTTIYTILEDIIKNYQKKIISIEAPVEKKISNILQLSLNDDENDLNNVFKQVLRHDPDIIFIGEIRDLKDVKLVVKAALSGHLVISSMHASSAINAINKLKEFDVSLIDIENILTYVSYQELYYDQSYKPFSIYEFLDNDDIRNYLSNSNYQYPTINLYKQQLSKEMIYYEGK